MSDERNPYASPKAEPPRATPTAPTSVHDSLGILLPLLLLALTVVHVAVACTYVYEPREWDLLRGGVCFAIAASCVWMLFARRIALATFFFASGAAIVIHLTRGASPELVVTAYGLQALFVLALVWQKRDRFR